MTTKEKAAGVLPAPEAAIQKRDRAIIVGNIGRVNQPMEQAMQSAGLQPFRDIDLVADGRLHRYRVLGDKAGSRNGWYVLHSDPLAGAFGSWKTGEQHTWHQARAKPTTAAERAALRKHMKAMQAARDAEQAEVHAQARAKAGRLWQQSRPAANAHGYLQRKRIDPIGIRQLGDMLVIPARGADGVLHTLQFIGPDGGKRFLTGGRIAGSYCALGRPTDVMLVCEGYATGATLHMATGYGVAVAFNCGNLTAVARALRSKFKTMRILVCADDDAKTSGNPGLTRAREAARAVGGAVAVPRFEGVRHGV